MGFKQAQSRLFKHWKGGAVGRARREATCWLVRDVERERVDGTPPNKPSGPCSKRSWMPLSELELDGKRLVDFPPEDVGALRTGDEAGFGEVVRDVVRHEVQGRTWNGNSLSPGRVVL